ncbi:hypothetical protein EPA93_02835 [Ktedonosporobacter rubrisoli]|uniref:Uncharacterized protein n=1 Tax=Ktedonosporobacter rubrisoli TaxID=2509675 RepID=A0A4P6JIS5_KTERU|nr:hypothetical protein [Ktedonosporobacter rubrisoli]QBD74984.1 hypothetical protein EPA93_02835 [Ktedonosporobacter rubrisoli]
MTNTDGSALQASSQATSTTASETVLANPSATIVPATSTTETTSTNLISKYMEHNLLLNGDAEAGPGATRPEEVIKSIPGWTTTGTFTPVKYDAISGTLQSSDPGPENRGENFFAGGIADNPNAVASAIQTIDLTEVTPLVDKGHVTYTLLAYLGGFGNFSNAADVQALFLDTNGQEIATAQVGPVLNQDRTIGSVTHQT